MSQIKISRINLAQRRLGAEVVYASDDFFAPKERLIDDAPPVFVPDKYDDHGKWMDGWESRRRRDGGHDFCVLHLGADPGLIESILIDTSHFTGNFPPEASIEATHTPERVPNTDDAVWQEIVSRQALAGDDQKLIEVENPGPWTHLRLNIFPDGGVARLRVYGRRDVDWSARDTKKLVDLAAIENGACAIACNDEHFGVVGNLISPGRGVNMGDGWETRRRREPGHDWCVVALGHMGVIKKILIDTAFFKGNFPNACSIQGGFAETLDLECLDQESAAWPEILPPQKMAADKEHWFENEINLHDPVTHVRLNLMPDGGVSRLRLLGLVS